MALLFIEGFEQYTDGDSPELTRGGWYSTSAVSNSFFPIEVGRAGGASQSVQMAFNGVALIHNVPSTADFTCGFAFKLDTSGPNGHTLITFRNELVDHIRILLPASGEIQIYRGTTLLEQTSGQGITQSIWYYIEIQALISNTGNYIVRLDGAEIMSDTSVDTQNGGLAQCDNIEFTGITVASPFIDDIYFLDTTGSDNTGFLGDCAVETIFPDADGNETDFTPLSSTNVSNVDDGSTPDDDTTYNSSSTATDRDLYGFAALQGNIDTIFGVDAKMLVRKEDAGFREVRVIGRSNVTEVESGNKTLGVDYVFVNHIFENDPDGGTDWDEAAVNAAQFGLDLQT